MWKKWRSCRIIPGSFKWEALGIPYALEGIKPPTKERVENAERILGIRK